MEVTPFEADHSSTAAEIEIMATELPEHISFIMFSIYSITVRGKMSRTVYIISALMKGIFSSTETMSTKKGNAEIIIKKAV